MGKPTSPHGDTLEVASKYFVKNGKPWIGVMGEFHFSRYDHREWRHELAKMKAGGITVVSSYLFWIYHEEVEGEFTFTDNNDLRAFVEACDEIGLDVFLRIGPWAHGECRNGGFPDWLYKKAPIQRQNDPTYLFYARRFYEKVYEQVKDQLFCNGGNIIGLQIENELVDQSEHLGTLKQMATEIGFDVPIYTVTGWGYDGGTRFPVDEFIPVFGGYPEGPWFEHKDPLPPSVHSFFLSMRNDGAIGADLLVNAVGKTSGWRIPYERYPFATCELGGGNQVTHHRRPIINPMDIYSLAVVTFGCGNNLIGYYMYHGGINPIGKLSTTQETKETGYPNDYSVLSYDFQAPLSEFGEAREHYRLLNQIHLFAQDFGHVIAPMEMAEATTSIDRYDTTSLRYAMRTDGNGGFVFVNHYQRLTDMADVRDVVFNTGAVQFPSIDVCGDIAFFMPFNLDLSGNLLRYATAQPLCRVEDTFFFTAIDGIKPEFCFEDGTVLTPTAGLNSAVSHNGIRIVLLTAEQATYARKLSGKLYVGDKCDLYEFDGALTTVAGGDFAYAVWNGTAFEEHKQHEAFAQAELIAEAVNEPFEPPYLRELTMNGDRSRVWKKLTVTTPDGFVEFPDACDVSQIYADGEMVADNYYIGVPWRVPAKLLYGKECYHVMSELKDDFYREF
ncbi:MAG: beta-galactosidase [Clostridia bacterium]|nr:beta-galactosidase [Clostridia bacterium]